MPIKTFKHKGLQELFVHGKTARIGAIYQPTVLKILDFLDAIADLKDCHGVKDFHALKGNRKGTYSMHVNKNYCVTFKWLKPDVLKVDFEDYH